MTSAFGRDILSGRKKLLKKADVKWVEHLPSWPEFNTKRIWLSAKARADWDEIKMYFPDFVNDALPNKQYLVNVINSVIPNLIMDTVKTIRNKKIAIEENESPIILSEEYYRALQNFSTISTNQRISGIHRLV